MADVQWIKIYTNMFDISRKIKHIERMPEGDTIIIIWFKLLLLAGKINDGGAIYITQSIPYDIEGLADELRRKPNIVEKALSVFEMFDMIERSNDFIYISSWEEYQNIEGLDKIREQNRLRKQKQREKQRDSVEVSQDSHGTVTGQITGSHATDKEKEPDEEEEQEQESESSIKKNGKKKKPTPAKDTTHAIFDRLYSDYDLSDTLIAKIREWITYKVERKESYQEQGLKSLLSQIKKKCAEYSEAALCELIDECMANNWKGIIFERLKPQNKNKSYNLDEFFEASVARSWEEAKNENPPKTAGNDESVRKKAEELKKKLG